MRDFSAAIGNYSPNPDVIESLSKVHFIALIGPSGIGKNAIANMLESVDAGTKKVISHTTRASRDDEKDGVDYYFETYNSDFIDRFAGQLAGGELVQATQHPTTGDLYYSTIDSYNLGGKSVMDTLPRAVEAMRSVPFGGRSEIMLVSPYPEWRQRFDKKSRGWTADIKQKRLAEAAANLKWGLGQAGVAWVINPEGQPDKAAADILSISGGEEYDSTQPKQLGQSMLKGLSG